MGYTQSWKCEHGGVTEMATDRVIVITRTEWHKHRKFTIRATVSILGERKNKVTMLVVGVSQGFIYQRQYIEAIDSMAVYTARRFVADMTVKRAMMLRESAQGVFYGD